MKSIYITGSTSHVVTDISKRMEWFGLALTGKLYTFEIAMALLVIGFTIITLGWKTTKVVKPKWQGGEDVAAAGSEEDNMSFLGNILNCFRQLRNDKRIVFVGLSVSLFEGSMYLWIVSWTQRIEEIL